MSYQRYEAVLRDKRVLAIQRNSAKLYKIQVTSDYTSLDVRLLLLCYYFLCRLASLAQYVFP
jgi:hypothetical protein